MKSMIKENGALEVEVPVSEVTWFNFLQFSRGANSQVGGWDFKTLWKEGGLKKLASDGVREGYLQRWTENSFGPGAPGIREEDFRLDRQRSEARRALLDKDRKLDASENRLNTWLFDRGAFPDWGRLAGYEVPLADESDGQLKVDLLAIDEVEPRITIIELKKADNAGNSPLMALTEAICYAIQAIRCREQLSKAIKAAGHAVTWAQFKIVRLVLAAPQAYWAGWKFKSELHVGCMQRIVEQVNAVLIANQDGCMIQFVPDTAIQEIRQEHIDCNESDQA